MKIQKYKKKGETLYKFSAYLGVDPRTGKQKRTNRQGFKTKREAELAYLRLKTEEERRSKGIVLFKTVYKKWLDVYKNTVQESTLNKTEGYFRLYILPDFGDFRIDKIKLSDVQSSVEDWSNRTARPKAILNYMSNVFDFAIRNRIVKDNPCRLVVVPKSENRKRVDLKGNFWEKEELNTFLKYTQNNFDYRWFAFFRLLAYTGVRRGEALALEWSDIDFKNKTLSVSKTLTIGSGNKQIIQSPKTSASHGTVALDSKTIEILRLHKLRQMHLSKLVFPNTLGKHMTLSTPSKYLKKAIKETGVKEISLHGLRHTHCSLLIAAGLDIKQIQERMRHANVQITLDIYAHLTKDKKDETMEKYIAYMNS